MPTFFSTRSAIVTRYVGPTNSTGSRIIARCSAGSVRMPYRYDLSVNMNHAEAATLLARKLGWTGTYNAGTLPSGDYVFTFDHADAKVAA